MLPLSFSSKHSCDSVQPRRAGRLKGTFWPHWVGRFCSSTKGKCTMIAMYERVISCTWRMCCPSHKLLPLTIFLYFLLRACFLAQLNHCFVKSRLVPLTLSISFYSPDSAEPANTINYQSRCWNALSNLEPQLNQSNNNESTGEGRGCVPARAAWELDEEALLVLACLRYQDTTQQRHDHLNKSIRLLLRPKMTWIKWNNWDNFF